MKHRSCQRGPFDLWVGHNVESPSIKSYLEPVIIACRYRSWLFYWDLTFYWSFTVGWPSCTSVYAQLGCCPNICIISLVFTWDAFKPKCVPLLFCRPPDLILIYISTEEERWSRGRISWGGICVVCEGRESSPPAGRRDQSYSVGCVYAHMSLVGEACSEAVTLWQTSISVVPRQIFRWRRSGWFHSLYFPFWCFHVEVVWMCELP